MTENPQPTPFHSLTESQVLTIEIDLEWLREDQSVFPRKLYDRFVQRHPVIRGSLLAAGFPKFQKAFWETFHSLVSVLRKRRNLQPALKERWTIPVLEFSPPMEGERFDLVVETFLEVLAECVEDAWCPAVETAWRTAVREIKDELVERGKVGRLVQDD